MVQERERRSKPVCLGEWVMLTVRQAPWEGKRLVVIGFREEPGGR